MNYKLSAINYEPLAMNSLPNHFNLKFVKKQLLTIILITHAKDS
jgi:hypothetical protein